MYSGLKRNIENGIGSGLPSHLTYQWKTDDGHVSRDDWYDVTQATNVFEGLSLEKSNCADRGVLCAAPILIYLSSSRWKIAADSAVLRSRSNKSGSFRLLRRIARKRHSVYRDICLWFYCLLKQGWEYCTTGDNIL